MQPYWDEKYRATARLWRDEPNDTLVAETASLAAGRAIDVGCGEGADAIWLASRGWHVTAVDISPVALERGAAHAAQAGVDVAQRIAWEHVELLAWRPPAAAFDLVTMHFVHLIATEREPLFRRLATAVAPGGSFLVVAHHPSDLQTRVRRPPDPAVFYTADDVAATMDPSIWQILVNEARPRRATDADGNAATVHDAVLHARRR